VKAVLDASAALEIVFGGTQAARLEEVLSEADVVLAPEPFIPEVVNAVRKYHRFEGLALSACDRALDAAIGLVDAFVSTKDIYSEAFLLARSGRRSAYDMFYLALARREDAVFLTVDAALRKETERQGVRVG